MRPERIFLLILGGYLIIGALYARLTPDWQAPDEPAHYNYVRQLAAGRLPVMEATDYDEAYKNEVVGSRFDPKYAIEPISYEDWQPPLYYLLQTPLYLATDGSLFAMRLFSLLLGAGVVASAYGVARQLFPKRDWLSLTTAAFVAFLPQHIAMLASVNNDSLSELLIALLLLMLMPILTQKRHPLTTRRLLLIGLLLGLGFLTKAAVYLMVPVIGLALLWRYWRQWAQLWQAGITLFVPAVLLGALWWGRNFAVYGGLDIMGKARHDAVVVGQPRTAALINEVGLWETSRRFLQTTFNSFWGQFGWMGVPMPDWVYLPLLIFTLTALVGLLLSLRRRSPRTLSPTTWALLLLFLLTLGLHIGYNITFIQHQGRYLFPALIPISVGIAVGLGLWIRPFSQRWPPLPYLLPLALSVILAALDLLALFRFIVPALTPPS